MKIKKMQIIKIALLIVILAEEIKRALFKQKLYNLTISKPDVQQYGFGNLTADELIEKLFEETISVVTTSND